MCVPRNSLRTVLDVFYGETAQTHLVKEGKQTLPRRCESAVAFFFCQAKHARNYGLLFLAERD